MCRTKKRNRRRGFTLIETLLVTAMVSVVALAIYSSFNSGIKVWQRLTKSTVDEELNIFFEKISEDLRNCFSFSSIEFVGRGDGISFATLTIAEMGQKEKNLIIGQVDYRFDAQAETLNRRQANYSQVYQNKSIVPRKMLNNVESLSFQYYYYDPKNEAYIWKDIWQQEQEQMQEQEQEQEIPLAVRIKLEFGKDAERKEVTRTITIPAGG